MPHSAPLLRNFDVYREVGEGGDYLLFTRGYCVRARLRAPPIDGTIATKVQKSVISSWIEIRKLFFFFLLWSYIRFSSKFHSWVAHIIIYTFSLIYFKLLASTSAFSIVAISYTCASARVKIVTRCKILQSCAITSFDTTFALIFPCIVKKFGRKTYIRGAAALSN